MTTKATKTTLAICKVPKHIVQFMADAVDNKDEPIHAEMWPAEGTDSDVMLHTHQQSIAVLTKVPGKYRTEFVFGQIAQQCAAASLKSDTTSFKYISDSVDPSYATSSAFAPGSDEPHTEIGNLFASPRLNDYVTFYSRDFRDLATVSIAEHQLLTLTNLLCSIDSVDRIEFGVSPAGFLVAHRNGVLVTVQGGTAQDKDLKSRLVKTARTMYADVVKRVGRAVSKGKVFMDIRADSPQAKLNNPPTLDNEQEAYIHIRVLDQDAEHGVALVQMIDKGGEPLSKQFKCPLGALRTTDGLTYDELVNMPAQ